jgi:hypothetical protein
MSEAYVFVGYTALVFLVFLVTKPVFKRYHERKREETAKRLEQVSLQIPEIENNIKDKYEIYQYLASRNNDYKKFLRKLKSDSITATGLFIHSIGRSGLAGLGIGDTILSAAGKKMMKASDDDYEESPDMKKCRAEIINLNEELELLKKEKRELKLKTLRLRRSDGSGAHLMLAAVVLITGYIGIALSF